VGSEDQQRTLYELLTPHAPYFAVSISYHNEGPISHWLGVLACELGQPARAAAHFERSAELATAFEQHPYALASQLELASLLQRTDQPRARRLLEATLAGAERLGLRPLLQRAQLKADIARID
jgi:hypothetical protein